MPRSLIASALLGAVVLVAAPPLAHAQRNPGVSAVCGSYSIGLDLFFVSIPLFDRPDEGWAYVDPAHRRVQATGVAHDVHVAASDTPANHDSHDADFKVLLDPGQEHLLSTQADDSLPVEWETGIAPSEKSGDGAQPIFPKWAWPSNGDRVWVDGNWIFDCGHPTGGLYKTEVHPARALAVMRDQAAPLPGTGLTPVPVTFTDLHISGRGGFAPQQLNCGVDIILGPNGSRCGQDQPPDDDAYKTTPINDTDFTFAVCLPPRPGAAAFSHLVVDGPGNNVHIDPDVREVAAAAPCLGDTRYDQGSMARVTVPLRGTVTPPESVYARRISAGWLVPPDPVLPHRTVTLDATDLHEDHDLDPGDGELTFWWLNVNRAPGTWRRLSDHAGGMDDYDDDFSVGDGVKHYAGATYDFYLRHGQGFAVRSTGFEQDCFDNLFDGTFFGHRRLELVMYAVCYSDLADFGAGDPIADAEGTFYASELGERTISGGGQYDMTLTIDEVPVGLEDTSYLSIHTSCVPDGEVALVGQPLTCATRVDNAGTGLPRQVRITTALSGPPAAALTSAAWSVREPFGTGTYDCTLAGLEARCQPDTVPVAARAPVNVTATTVPAAPGLLVERAEVTTASSDPELTDNVAVASIEVFQPIAIDVAPRDATNVVNLGRGGSLTVAVLTTAAFDAAAVDPGSVCFGDAEEPGQRTCAEQHLTGHLEDVNKDRLPDLVLHYAVAATGIDPGDTQACLRGRTLNGVGVIGCDAVSTR